MNFDSLLSDQMKNIISDNKREKGNLLRTNYELIGAAEGSQQDLMGISDYDYENALNYISASLEKIISSVP